MLYRRLQLLHYVYGIVGVVWFAGTLTELTDVATGAVNVHYDSLYQAQKTLFQVGTRGNAASPRGGNAHLACHWMLQQPAQLMTGSSWYKVMYATIDATGDMTTTLFYLSYVALVLLLFSNVFIGLVVDRFQVRGNVPFSPVLLSLSHCTRAAWCCAPTVTGRREGRDSP